MASSIDSKEIESLSFEDCYARLEQIVHKLEAGDLPLGASMSLYEEGMRLAQQCGQRLDAAELRVNELLSAVADQLDDDLDTER